MSGKTHKEYGLFFWLHTAVQLVLYLSWLLFSWWIVLLGVIALQLQYLLLGGCVLSKAEFKNDESCSVYYLHKWGLIRDKKWGEHFFTYYINAIGILVAVVWQLVFGMPPWIL